MGDQEIPAHKVGRSERRACFGMVVLMHHAVGRQVSKTETGDPLSHLESLFGIAVMDKGMHGHPIGVRPDRSLPIGVGLDDVCIVEQRFVGRERPDTMRRPEFLRLST